jgi:hypothetical protein
MNINKKIIVYLNLENSSSILKDSQPNQSHRYVTLQNRVQYPKTDFKLPNTGSMQHAGRLQDGNLGRQLCLLTGCFDMLHSFILLSSPFHNSAQKDEII